MNATPRRLRSLSASLLTAVTTVALTACSGLSPEVEEQVELASAVVEGEVPGVRVDADALSCAIELAELSLEDEAQGFDQPPPAPCPPPIVTDIDAGSNGQGEAEGRGLDIDYGGVGPVDPVFPGGLDAPNDAAPDAALLGLQAYPLAGDESQEPIEPLEPAPEPASRPPKMGTVPQLPISIDKPTLAGDDTREPEQTQIDPLTHAPLKPEPLTAAPITQYRGGIALGLKAPTVTISNPMLLACMNDCAQTYAVCVANPNHELLECADALSVCSLDCQG